MKSNIKITDILLYVCFGLGLFITGNIKLFVYIYIAVLLYEFVQILIDESKNKNNRKRLIKLLRSVIYPELYFLFLFFLNSSIVLPSSKDNFFCWRNIMLISNAIVYATLLLIVKHNLKKEEQNNI